MDEGPIFRSYCKYGLHKPKNKCFRKLHQTVYGAPDILSGEKWVNGPAGTIFQRSEWRCWIDKTASRLGDNETSARNRP